MCTAGYYVDGHERQDVLEHRVEWLGKELQLELRQYLWVQLTVEEATKLSIPGYTSPGETHACATSTPKRSQKSVRRKFERQKKRVTPKQLSKEQKAKQERVSQLVESELVYAYTNAEGDAMVEVHVDLLPQSVRCHKSTKLTIHGISFDMGGNLSVRFPVGEAPIIKVGTEEIIFKVCIMCKIYKHIM